MLIMCYNASVSFCMVALCADIRVNQVECLVPGATLSVYHCQCGFPTNKDLEKCLSVTSGGPKIGWSIFSAVSKSPANCR